MAFSFLDLAVRALHGKPPSARPADLHAHTDRH